MRDWFIYRQPDFTVLMLMHRSSGSFNIPSPIPSFPPLSPPPPPPPTPSSNPRAFYRRPCPGSGEFCLGLEGGAFEPIVSRLSSVKHVFWYSFREQMAQKDNFHIVDWCLEVKSQTAAPKTDRDFAKFYNIRWSQICFRIWKRPS